MNLIHIFKYINYYTSRGFNLCFYKNAIDYYAKDGWNVDQKKDLVHYQNGQMHREDGPAVIICRDGSIRYWVNGTAVHVSNNDDFVKRNKLKVFW